MGERMENTFENSGVPLSMQAIATIVANGTMEQPPGPELPEGYKFGPFDICNGRGKSHWNMPGNVTFRLYIQEKVHGYMILRSKAEKTKFVNNIVHELRKKGFRFLSETPNHRWQDIGDAQAKNKVGHSLRDQVSVIRKALQVRSMEEAESMAQDANVTIFDAAEEASRKRKAEEMRNAETARLLLEKRAATARAVAAAASQVKAQATVASTLASVKPAMDSVAVKNQITVDCRGEDKIHMDALRTRLTQVIGDLNNERHEKRRLMDENANLREENANLREENANLRKEAEKSRAEFNGLKSQVENLTLVVRELWSQQGGTLKDLRFLTADALHTVARVVGVPNHSTYEDASDAGSEKSAEGNDQGRDNQCDETVVHHGKGVGYHEDGNPNDEHGDDDY